MRGRGLKHVILNVPQTRLTVALHAGAWIETYMDPGKKELQMVALHAGAWIETLLPPLQCNNFCVALHAGAWIETSP